VPWILRTSNFFPSGLGIVFETFSFLVLTLFGASSIGVAAASPSALLAGFFTFGGDREPAEAPTSSRPSMAPSKDYGSFSSVGAPTTFVFDDPAGAPPFTSISEALGSTVFSRGGFGLLGNCFPGAEPFAPYFCINLLDVFVTCA
jgi:hypothetical protein